MLGSALEAVAGDRSRVLVGDRSPGQLPCSLPGLCSSPFSHPGIVSDEARKVFPSLARVEKFLAVAESFCTMDAPPAQLWLERLVPHGRLRMRTLQWHLKAHLSPESDPPSLPVPLPQEVRRDLSWWMVRDHLLTGVRFGTPAPDLHLYSDASCSGWGAHLLDQHVSGVWSPQILTP